MAEDWQMPSLDPNQLAPQEVSGQYPPPLPSKAELEALLRKPAGFDHLTRKRFDLFVGRVFTHLKPTEAFSNNWLVQTMTWHLTEVMEGREKRLIINVPPRQLKSICTSVAYPAFMLGQNPTNTFILVCYSRELGEKMMLDLRSVLRSDWYKRVFPNTKLRRDTAGEVITTKGGGVNMTSVHGTLTGRGAGTIIVDDPIKAADAQSEAERNRTNQWMLETLFSRLDEKQHGKIIIAMQRLHENDVIGHLTQNDDHGWTILKVPAIANEAAAHPVLRPLGLNTNDDQHASHHRREVGDVIDPSRESVETLEQLRKDLGNLTFSAQYQQDPVLADGNLVKPSWFRSYMQGSVSPKEIQAGQADAAHGEEIHAPVALPTRFDAIVASWDTASSAGLNNDYSVGTIWGVLEHNYFLLDLYRIKATYPDLKRMMVDRAKLHKVNLVLLEKADSGRNLFHDMRRDRTKGFDIQAIPPESSKENRLSACSAIIEQGRVYLPTMAEWKSALLSELSTFPNSKHDDQVDSVSMFLNFMRTRRSSDPLQYDEKGSRVRRRR
jgi:predicted phage terminase large subunit-like protein